MLLLLERTPILLGHLLQNIVLVRRAGHGGAAPAPMAPKANLAKAFATAAGGKKRGAPVKRGGAALLNAFPATKKARAGV